MELGPRRMRGLVRILGREGSFGNGRRFLISGRAGIDGSLSAWTCAPDGWAAVCLPNTEWLGVPWRICDVSSGFSLLWTISSTSVFSDGNCSSVRTLAPPSFISNMDTGASWIRSCWLVTWTPSAVAVLVVAVGNADEGMVDTSWSIRSFSTNSLLS